MNAQEIKGHWNQIQGKVKEKWGQLTDDDLRLAEGNFDQFVGRIEQKTGEARRNVEAFLDELIASDTPVGRAKETVVDYGRAAAETMRQGADQMREGYQRAEQMVQTRPAESMAVMFGLGFLTGVTLTMLLSNSDR